MPRTIRFHLDEHVDPAIADGLRRRRIDVTTARDAGLLGASDEDHLSFANNEQRVIVTNDSDFLRLHAEGCPHPGIVYGHQQSRSMGDILHRLGLIWEILEPGEMRGRIEFL